MDTNEGFGIDDAGRSSSEASSNAALRALVERVRQLEVQVAELRLAGARGASGTAAAPREGILSASDSLPGEEGRAATVLALPPPPPPVIAGVQASMEHRPRKSFEDRLGSQIFNGVGILALLIGTSWFLKLAFEHGWIGPAGRVLIGLGAGSGLVVWSGRFRRKGLAAFSYSLKAIGAAVLYLALWAGFQLYHLLPGGAALAAMVLVTCWIAFMAWSQDAELLAGYALLGGFATPLLLATGGNHEAFLFTYVAVIDAATVLLLRVKPWPRLALPALVATVAYFIGWYATWFDKGAYALRGEGGALPGEFWLTAGFVLLFFALFALVSVRGWGGDAGGLEAGGRGDVIVSLLIPLGNAAFAGLALYSIFEDSGLHGYLAWVAVALAAVYLALMRVQRTPLAAAMHLAAGVVFLTIAIPLKASGQSLTTAWLVEGLALYWVSLRFEGMAWAVSGEAAGDSGSAGSDRARRVLRGLSLAGYGLGLGSLVAHWFWSAVSIDHARAAFLNANLGSALVAVATLGGAAFFAVRSEGGGLAAGLGASEAGVSESHERGERSPAASAVWLALLATGLVAVLLCVRELASAWSVEASHAAFGNADLWTAVVGLAVLAAACFVAYRLLRRDGVRFASLRLLAGAGFVAFNLLAILSVEREIGALWHTSESGVQRSLTISGFLMVYGAALLAIGFWRRSAFVRWQALILMIGTSAKVFLYDISGLSQGYRVASFLALGVLLMGVSYAYQKDWLGLKQDGLKDGELREQKAATQ